MSDRSSIEWTQATWNPTTGCDRTSPGCDHCYALTLAKRLKAMGNPKYQNDGSARTSGPGFGLTLHRDQLDLPRRWASARVVFVNSMSDLFHKDVPLGFIRDVFAVMAETPRHTYQVLTKRSKRLAQIADKLEWSPNIWMGVSVEADNYAFRVDHLREVDAAVRFISAEPLLGPLPSLNLAGIHWVIAGGESGKSGSTDAPRLGSSTPRTHVIELKFRSSSSSGVRGHLLHPNPGSRSPLKVNWSSRTRLVGVPGAPAPVRRSSKTAAGRLLDGRTWDEMPAQTRRHSVIGTASWPNHGSGTRGVSGKPRCCSGPTCPPSQPLVRRRRTAASLIASPGNRMLSTGRANPFPGSRTARPNGQSAIDPLGFFRAAEKIAVPLETALRTEFPDRHIHVIGGDCNERITEGLDWLRNQGTATSGPQLGPVFALLDPDSMELKWSTIETIAKWTGQAAPRD